MEYNSYLTLTNGQKKINLTLIFFGKYIKTDDEAIDLALTKCLTSYPDNPSLKTTTARYERAANNGSPKDVKLFWDALDQLSNGELDEITNIFEFSRKIQLEVFNDFIINLPFRTKAGILFSFIKTKDFQVN